MKKKGLSSLVLLAILGAWAVVLRLFDFPILPYAPFLKVDLSDLMALVGMLVEGPIGLIAVAGIRDLVNYLMKGGEAGLPIGEVMSFIATLSFYLPLHFYLKSDHKSHTTKSPWKASILSILSLVIIMGLLNYFVALPLYVKVMNFPIDNYFNYVMVFILPFNAIKGAILALAQVLIWKSMLDPIEKRGRLYPLYPSVIPTHTTSSRASELNALLFDDK